MNGSMRAHPGHIHVVVCDGDPGMKPAGKVMMCECLPLLLWRIDYLPEGYTCSISNNVDGTTAKRLVDSVRVLH